MAADVRSTDSSIPTVAIDLTRVATENVACPICAAATVHHCNKTTWEIRRCVACGHGFVSNRPTLDGSVTANADESTRHVLGAFTAESYERRADARAFAAVVARATTLRGAALDVGSGDGSFSYHLCRQGFRPVMLDLDPRAAQACVHMPGSSLTIGTFESFESEQRMSVIMMSQVLEHALDPMLWLRKAARLLEPGGVLAIGLPNFAGIYRLRGARDPFLIPPIHLNFFSPASMRRALKSAGLDLIKLGSVSGMTTPRRPILAAVLNVALRPLNFSTRGIMLQVLATVGR